MIAEFKSKEELYFSYYLEELKEAGFIINWYYEKDKFELTPKVELPYKKQLVSKIKKDFEFLLHPSSITADFTIEWDKSAENIFYLNPEIPVINVKDIPFRVLTDNISYVESKQARTFKANTSDISFPYKQKFVYLLHGIFIQKIVPFNLKLKPESLFSLTFVPDKVLKEEIYKVNTKDKKGIITHKPGDSKFLFKTKTLKEFLYERERI